jgi:signal transduction histidine kinase
VDPQTGRDLVAHAAEVEHLIADDPESPAAPTTSGDPSRPRGRVLIVDDNPDLRVYLSGLLSAAYDVTTAADGLEALSLLRARQPDIVVSDVMMPRLDGFGLVRQLREDPRTASLPIILLSARAGEDSSVEGLAAGVDDYLVKPFSARELLARVNTHVKLAQARRAWIAELERANRELDAFSYSVSHDLRAPLRAISGFSHAVLESSADKLDDESKRWLENVRSGCQRMGEMIDDLLDLARVTRCDLSRGKVDLGALARDVLANLRSAEPERSVEVVIAVDLLAEADPRLMRSALENLLGNAWKFTRRTPRPVIEVGATRADGRITYFIRDNGAGFRSSAVGKLFAPFQRLHAESEFEGTGVGLATVQRIIHRHSGRIWAEGDVGKGATFYFTLNEPKGLDNKGA